MSMTTLVTHMWVADEVRKKKCMRYGCLV